MSLSELNICLVAVWQMTVILVWILSSYGLNFKSYIRYIYISICIYIYIYICIIFEQFRNNYKLNFYLIKIRRLIVRWSFLFSSYFLSFALRSSFARCVRLLNLLPTRRNFGCVTSESHEEQRVSGHIRHLSRVRINDMQNFFRWHESRSCRSVYPIAGVSLSFSIPRPSSYYLFPLCHPIILHCSVAASVAYDCVDAVTLIFFLHRSINLSVHSSCYL